MMHGYRMILLLVTMIQTKYGLQDVQTVLHMNLMLLVKYTIQLMVVKIGKI